MSREVCRSVYIIATSTDKTEICLVKECRGGEFWTGNMPQWMPEKIVEHVLNSGTDEVEEKAIADKVGEIVRPVSSHGTGNTGDTGRISGKKKRRPTETWTHEKKDGCRWMLDAADPNARVGRGSKWWKFE